MITLKGLDTNL